MRIFSIILLLTTFTACGQKQKSKDDVTADRYNSDKITCTESNADLTDSESPFLIIIPPDLELNDERFDYIELLEDHLDDTLGVGMLSANEDYMVGLLRQLRLNEKWLCIMFPDKDYGIVDVQVDTLRTTEWFVNDFPQDYHITLLSVMDKERNKRALSYNREGETLLNYSIAFRGDYDISDFYYYYKKAISGQDSLHVTNTIRNAMLNGNVKLPYYLPTDSLHLVEMYGLKEGIYAAKYKPEYQDDLQGGYTRCYSVFLIKDDSVLLWDSADYSIALEVFSLKGQDYVCVEKYSYATSFTDLFTLNEDKLKGIYHSMFTGD